MSEPRSTFRDFGIIPDKLSPPAEMIRASISRWGVVGQYATTFAIIALGVCLTVWFGLWMPSCLSLPGCPAIATAFGLLIYFVIRGDYGTIELRGTTLRATHIYTGRVLERSIDEIESLTTIVNRARRLETVVEEKLFGRVKGVELRFRGELLPLKVLRKGPAMANAQALIEGIVYRMQERCRGPGIFYNPIGARLSHSSK